MVDRRFATEFINPVIMQDQRVRQALMPAGSGAFDRLEQGTYDDAIMRRARGMGSLPAGGGLPTPPPMPKSPSLMDRLTPAMGTPAAAGLGAAAATGLQLSGYRPVPITTGEGLGAMMQAGMKAYTAERKAQQAAELARQQRETDIALKMMEIRAATGQKAFSQEKELRKEFTTASKDFSEALLGLEKVQNAAMTKSPSGATDIALVFGYMKVLDPNSVVREGEFATAANAGGISERIRATYNRLVSGGGEILTPDLRRQFISAARTQFQPYLSQQQSRETDYIDLTEAYNLDPTKVVKSRMPKQGALSNPFSVSSEDEIEALSSGDYFYFKGKLGRKN